MIRSESFKQLTHRVNRLEWFETSSELQVITHFNVILSKWVRQELHLHKTPGHWANNGLRWWTSRNRLRKGGREEEKRKQTGSVIICTFMHQGLCQFVRSVDRRWAQFINLLHSNEDTARSAKRDHHTLHWAYSQPVHKPAHLQSTALMTQENQTEGEREHQIRGDLSYPATVIYQTDSPKAHQSRSVWD